MGNDDSESTIDLRQTFDFLSDSEDVEAASHSNQSNRTDVMKKYLVYMELPKIRIGDYRKSSCVSGNVIRFHFLLRIARDEANTVLRLLPIKAYKAPVVNFAVIHRPFLDDDSAKGPIPKSPGVRSPLINYDDEEASPGVPDSRTDDIVEDFRSDQAQASSVDDQRPPSQTSVDKVQQQPTESPKRRPSQTSIGKVKQVEAESSQEPSSADKTPIQPSESPKRRSSQASSSRSSSSSNSRAGTDKPHKTLCIAMLSYLLRCRTPKKLSFTFGLLAIVSLVSTLLLCFRFNNKHGKGIFNLNSFRQTEKAANQSDLSQLPSAEFYIQVLGTKSPRRGDQFDPQISETELRATLKLLWQFLDLCEKHSIPAMLYGGTLLCSYRHHGFIPWDDDLDLLLSKADKGKLRKALNEHPNLLMKDVGLWKVSIKTACLTKNIHGCWPFIDLGFYQVRNGWVAQEKTDYRYPVNITFPLHKRPFMGRWVDSPRDALTFLDYTYGPSDSCQSNQYSHRVEAMKKTPTEAISCRKLARTYPFVFRTPASATLGRGVLETLKLPHSEAQYTVPVNEPMSAINKEYSTIPAK